MKNEWKNNITKMYVIRFLREFTLFSGVLIPFFTEWGNLNFTQILTLQAWFTFCLFIMEVPTGVVADKWGRKPSISIGLFFLTLAPLVYASTSNFFVFMISEFLWATAGAFMSGADESMIYESLKKINKSKISKSIFGKKYGLGMLALTIAAPIGSLLSIFLGVRGVVALTFLPFFAAFIVSFTLKEPNGEKLKEQKYFNILKTGLNYFKKNKILKILAFDMISIQLVGYSLIWTYQKIMMNRGLDNAYLGFISAGMTLTQLLIIANFMRIDKIIKSKKLFLMLSAIIPSIFMILLGTIESLTFSILFIIISAISLARRPYFSSHFNKHLPDKIRATTISTIGMILMLTITVVNPFMGMMIDWNINFTLIIIGIFGLGAALFSKVEEDVLNE